MTSPFERLNAQTLRRDRASARLWGAALIAAAIIMCALLGLLLIAAKSLLVGIS